VTKTGRGGFKEGGFICKSKVRIPLQTDEGQKTGGMGEYQINKKREGREKLGRRSSKK